MSHRITITTLTTTHKVSSADVDKMLTGPEPNAASLLDTVDIEQGVTRVHVSSRDGSYSASIPIEDFCRGGVVSSEQGGYRLRVISGATLCWNVKDVGSLRLTTTREPDSVPEKPTH